MRNAVASGDHTAVAVPSVALFTCGSRTYSEHAGRFTNKRDAFGIYDTVAISESGAVLGSRVSR
jgi:hypothetical protein